MNTLKRIAEIVSGTTMVTVAFLIVSVILIKPYELSKTLYPFSFEHQLYIVVAAIVFIKIYDIALKLMFKPPQLEFIPISLILVIAVASSVSAVPTWFTANLTIMMAVGCIPLWFTCTKSGWQFVTKIRFYKK